MDWGVVAFIDALAVKGIWRRHEPGAVLDSFDAVKTLARQLKQDIDASPGGDLWERVVANLTFFSDSVAVTVVLPPPLNTEGSREYLEFYSSTRRYMLLRHVVQFLSVLVGRATLGPVPLIYRGCISAGPMMVRGESFIGAAVDAAGARFEACDGAFVFLTPEAAEVFTKRHPFLQMGHPAYFVPYRVPMKGGEALETITINPLLYLDQDQKSAAAAAFAREFGPLESQPEHVRSKAANTLSYLEYLVGWQA